MGQAFVHIATYAKHVNLGFNQGTLLNDPDAILKGTGKLIRHVRIEKLHDVNKKALASLISAAIELGIEMAEDAGGKQKQTLKLKLKQRDA